MKYFTVIVWFILFMVGLNLSFEMISNPSTIENVLGIFVIFAIIFISYKTKLFTNLNIKKNKNEKN